MIKKRFKTQDTRHTTRKGIVLILTFIVLVILTIIVFAFLSMMSYEMKSVGAQTRDIKAFYIAEAGRAKARWALLVDEQPLPWTEEDTALGAGTFTVTAADDLGDGSATTITSSGYIPNDTNPIARRQVVEADIVVGSGALTNFSSGADISASSEKLPSNSKENAIDGDSGTSWKSNSKDDAWLQLDFGSSQTFNRVVYSGSNINSVTIEYSSNGSDWTTAGTGSSSPVNFTSVDGQYLKFTMSVDISKTAEVNEMETYNSDEEVDPTLGNGKFSTSW
jgi:hypothetical protein